MRLVAKILREKLLHKECLRFIERVEREANAQPPKESRLLRFILENMLVMDAESRKTAGECLKALAQTTFDSGDNGGGVESSEITGKDGDGGGNGATGGSRGDHGDDDWDVPTERPRSAVQARPSRIIKRRVSRSPSSSSNRRGTKRQYILCTPEATIIPCTPEATNIQPPRVMTCDDSVSHI